MAKFSIRELLDAGFHFGHQTKRWNPKMDRFIFTARNSIHIIDLQQTVRMLRDAYNQVRDCSKNGGVVLFVGTKRQSVDMIAEVAKGSGQYYVNHRWLGGTLTNWKTIQGSISRLKGIERMKTDGTYEALTKKEVQNLERSREKMERSLGGIKDMPRQPDLMVVIDTNKESIAVQEANKLKIPVVALVDTNCNPDPIDWVVPGNDDAIRSLKLFLDKMAAAVAEGRQILGEDLPSPSGAPATNDVGEEMIAAAAAADAEEAK
ncbi:MAG: 30S ribosomal protein S2 [Magnetococcales bacterium]|nr:30S ribosomal protein S2 [Magnetococcales bacterium]